MNKSITIIALQLLICILGFLAPAALQAQNIIEIPHSTAPNTKWDGGEKEYYTPIWQTQVVTNVSTPTMEVFRPEIQIDNGTAVIVAPGGGLYGLSIESEGNEVARWLNKKGVTAFVLKYRLVPTGEDGIKEITELGRDNPQQLMANVAEVLPWSIEDGLSAIRYVRSHADTYAIDPDKIGFMGFSAGGAVTLGIAYKYDAASRPNFLIPVYPWTTAMPVQEVPDDAPPILIICATDDPLGLAKGSVELYQSWLDAEKSAGLHMYSKGGHGFGMKTQGLPSDEWIQRFYEWALAQDLVISNKE